MAISSFVSALEISLSSPTSAKTNEEFPVTISVDSEETFDVKIFAHNSEDDKVTRSEYISEIYNGDWEDSWYYLPEAFPKDKEFRIKVLESEGERTICARLRKTSTQTTYLKCNQIEILQGEKIEDIIEKTEEEIPIQKLEETKPEEKLEEIPLTNQEPIEERILLNSPKQNENIITTKSEKFRNGIVYSFVVFLIAIIFVVLLRNR